MRVRALLVPVLSTTLVAGTAVALTSLPSAAQPDTSTASVMTVNPLLDDVAYLERERDAQVARARAAEAHSLALTRRLKAKEAEVTRLKKARTPRASRSAERTGGSAPSGVWSRLAQCESGGNPRTNTGNGYYGMYQFSLTTWRSVGGSGSPHNASAAEQTRRAQILQQRSGWGQWPACSRKLGLR